MTGASSYSRRPRRGACCCFGISRAVAEAAVSVTGSCGSPNCLRWGGSRRNWFVDDWSGTHFELFASFNLLPTLTGDSAPVEAGMNDFAACRGIGPTFRRICLAARLDWGARATQDSRRERRHTAQHRSGEGSVRRDYSRSTLATRISCQQRNTCGDVGTRRPRVLISQLALGSRE